jgi:hypothetical protein
LAFWEVHHVSVLTIVFPSFSVDIALLGTPDVCCGSRLCENSVSELARRKFVSITLNKKRTVLAAAVERRKERKQFCEFLLSRVFTQPGSILLQKSFWGSERKFLEQLTRPSRNGVSDTVWFHPKSTTGLRSSNERRCGSGAVQKSTSARFLELLSAQMRSAALSGACLQLGAQRTCSGQAELERSDRDFHVLVGPKAYLTPSSG